jgi:hypothetical protein
LVSLAIVVANNHNQAPLSGEQGLA